jgi:diguanylate cyclase (GGDEF)-like protein
MNGKTISADDQHPEGQGLAQQAIEGTWLGRLPWLAGTPAFASEAERRRAHLLAWLLLFLILLSASALLLVMYIDAGKPAYGRVYALLICAVTTLFVSAYLLHSSGHFLLAGGLTVAAAGLGPWGSLVFDPGVLQGDLLPLTYVTLTILLSSILLPPLATVIVAAFQLLLLTVLPAFSPAAAAFINWPSLVAMVFISAVLSILISLIEQRDKKQIESQTLQLAHSNELITSLSQITTRLEKVHTPAGMIEALGEELQGIGLTCVVAMQGAEGELFKINYASLPAEVVGQMHTNPDFPLMGAAFPLDTWKSMLNSDEVPAGSFVTTAEEEIRLVFHRAPQASDGAMLSAMGIDRSTVLLRLPLTFETKLLGILWVWGTGLQPEDCAILATFAKQAATSLDRARLFQEVQSLALSDPLTGLHNRRSLFELGKIEFARAMRMRRPFCCMMLDLDHFKMINDNYGHQTGDQVLQEFAARCGRSIRQSDLLGRYGGEELVILLPETDLEAAVQVAERLRQAVAEAPIFVPGKELNITVSIGVAMRDEGTTELEALIRRADQAAYLAKHNGRNCVAVSPYPGPEQTRLETV